MDSVNRAGYRARFYIFTFKLVLPEDFSKDESNKWSGNECIENKTGNNHDRKFAYCGLKNKVLHTTCFKGNIEAYHGINHDKHHHDGKNGFL